MLTKSKLFDLLASFRNCSTFDDLNSCKVFWQSNTDVDVDKSFRTRKISYSWKPNKERTKNKEDRKFLSHSKPGSRTEKLSSFVFEMLGVLERTNPVLLQGHLEIKPLGD